MILRPDTVYCYILYKFSQILILLINILNLKSAAFMCYTSQIIIQGLIKTTHWKPNGRYESGRQKTQWKEGIHKARYEGI